MNEQSFIDSVDDRTSLAGTNKLEVLLFSLGKDIETGREEVYGINVFKVREVMRVPEITQAPGMPKAVEGVVSLRGAMVPVINLAKFCEVNSAGEPGILMVTEYNDSAQGFLVDSVDVIHRLSWDEVKAPPSMVNGGEGGFVTAVTELSDDRLVMIMDVERILSGTTGIADERAFDGVRSSDATKGKTVLFADDSSVARSQIKRTLDKMVVKYLSADTGAKAWSMLQNIAEHCETTQRDIRDEIGLVLTDVEMPEMDGYVLTRKIKDDARLKELPVIMHSSLTADQNADLGKNIGADAYVSKFKPAELAEKINSIMAQ